MTISDYSEVRMRPFRETKGRARGRGQKEPQGYPTDPRRREAGGKGHCLITVISVILSFAIGILLNAAGLFPGAGSGDEKSADFAASAEQASELSTEPAEIQLMVYSPDTQDVVQSIILHPGDVLPTPEAIAGFQFSGWNTHSDGSGLCLRGGDVFDFALTQPIVLYSQWSPPETQASAESAPPQTESAAESTPTGNPHSGEQGFTETEVSV